MINAALALAAKPNSKVAQDNMDLFKEQWEKQVRVLTDAVDDITSIDDFLSVSGEHEKLSPSHRLCTKRNVYRFYLSSARKRLLFCPIERELPNSVKLLPFKFKQHWRIILHLHLIVNISDVSVPLLDVQQQRCRNDTGLGSRRTPDTHGV